MSHKLSQDPASDLAHSAVAWGWPVSVEAISWALNLAPVPADRGGQPSSACKLVLVGLANHAGPDGTGAFAPVATLVRYTGLSERTVRACLDRLEAEGIIRPGDPEIVAARLKRAHRRPQGWDLNLAPVRDDLDDAITHQCSGLGTRLASAAQPVANGRPNGVRAPRPAATVEAVDTWPDGVQLTRERGAAVAPEPYREPSREPSAVSARVHEARLAAGAANGGGPVSEFFAELGDAWALAKWSP
jgi:hypothetical protein